MAERNLLGEILAPHARYRQGKNLLAEAFNRDAPGITGLDVDNFLGDMAPGFRDLQAMQRGETVDPNKAALSLIENYGGAPMAARVLQGVGPATGNFMASFGGVKPQPQGIKAYHGSPHDFDRFDMSKIGTGEGAQAYGHGLYFAEKEGVARSYRDQLSASKAAIDYRVNGQPVPVSDVAAYKAAQLAFDAGGASKALAALRADRAGVPKQYFERMENQLAAMAARGDVVEMPPANPGRLYEVNIKANPDDFFDWDRPLSQQSEKVRGALQNLGRMPDVTALRQEIAALEQAARLATTIDAGGQRIFHGGKAAAYRNSPEAAQLDAARKRLEAAEVAETQTRTPRDLSEALGYTTDRVGMTNDLMSQGVKGIRYLDQGSRAAGDGSRNYVVFDDSLVEILRKYGLLGMLGGGAYAGTVGSAGTAEAAGSK